jgi:hypothetical protein
MYCCDVVVGEVDLDCSAETASVRHFSEGEGGGVVVAGDEMELVVWDRMSYSCSLSQRRMLLPS